MNLRAKVYVENQKKKIQEELSTRLARLKEEGGKDRDIQRDATVRRPEGPGPEDGLSAGQHCRPGKNSVRRGRRPRSTG